MVTHSTAAERQPPSATPVGRSDFSNQAYQGPPSPHAVAPSRSRSDASSNSSPRFPFSIVWTPLPGITCLVPSIGHVGVCTSKGVVHDFAASCTLGINCLAFGDPHKVWKLDTSAMDIRKWDRAIIAADRKFARLDHNIFTNNCHHHVVAVLNTVAYRGKSDWSQFSLWWHLMWHGQFISLRYYCSVYFFSVVIWICAFVAAQLIADVF